MKKLFLVGGGTGGHCIPINVVYSEAPKNFKCFILTDNRGQKYFDNIDSNNVIILRNLISSQSRLANIINSPFLFIQSILYNFKIKPDYTIGFGGFFTIPVLFASLIMRKKIFLHEGNAFIGKANKLLFKYVGNIFTTFNETHGEKLIQNKNSFRVGLPTRSSKNLENKETNKKNQLKICILGGSQGAKNLSDNIAHSIIKSKNECKKEFIVYHQCRKEDVNLVEKLYRENSIECYVNVYFSNVTDILENTNLIISRAGSSTVNEIICFGIPSILIPYPYAADNHQYYNASVLKSLNCAEIIKDKDMNTYLLSSLINKIINSPQRRESIKETLKKEYINNSVERIFKHIEASR